MFLDSTLMITQYYQTKSVEFLQCKACNLCIVLVFMFVSQPIYSQLTESSKISLITIGPGEDLYSTFGHSALYISDPTLAIDNIYNYGTYSFTEEFYMKFIKGELNYMLSVAPFQQEYYTWTSLENRKVYCARGKFVSSSSYLYHFFIPCAV